MRGFPTKVGPWGKNAHRQFRPQKRGLSSGGLALNGGAVGRKKFFAGPFLLLLVQLLLLLPQEELFLGVLVTDCAFVSHDLRGASS